MEKYLSLKTRAPKNIVALKEILCKSTTDFNREIEELKHRTKISHPSIVRLIAYTSKAEDNLCASFYKILLILDYLEQDFDREINSRKTNSEFYTEEKLWYFLESALSALLCLQSKGVAHGDLKPSNIFITKNGEYKIAEQSLLGNVMPSYALRLSGFDDVRAYLSPALVQNLARQELYPKHDTFKSDIFTLGLTVLHAATLTNCDSFFDYDRFSLDIEALQKRVASLALRYSEQFQRFVSSMLTLEESKRPSAGELIERIPIQDNLKKEPVQSEPKVNQVEKRLQNVHFENNDEEEVPVKAQTVSVKAPHHYTHSAAPGEQGGRVETLGNKLNVRMGAKPSVLKEDFEPSPIKPLDEPSNDNFRDPEAESFVPTHQATYAQYNQRGSSSKKETPSYLQSQYTQPIQVQPTYPQQQHRADPYSSSYKPSDDIAKILNEYRSGDSGVPTTTQRSP